MTDKPKLTPWFPGTVKPWEAGVYPRKQPKSREIYFSRWSGRYWCVVAKDPRIAAQKREKSMYQNWPWRGLAEKP